MPEDQEAPKPGIDRLMGKISEDFWDKKKPGKKERKKAAEAFAKEELGEEQFTNNPDAAKAIMDYFEAGAKWMSKNTPDADA